ncbi:hypothetical protein K3495_g982 [Podosphaera aphanis]|nr:hypothetical protein K3495_g982 [Podosphaera aphanis]
MEPTPTDKNKSRHPGKLAALKFMQRLKEVTDFAQAAMASVQQRNESNGNMLRRQPERFIVGNKVWLNLRHIQSPQLSKKLAWQHAKYEVTNVPDALIVELNVPGNIHKRFHVELVKRADTDPFPSQYRDDARNPPIIDNLEEPEYEVESILRARTIRPGRGTFRQPLVKWVSEANPTWEPVESIQDTEALDTFENLYGPVDKNDGPSDTSVRTFVGPAEHNTMRRRRERQRERKKIKKQKQHLLL